MIIKKKKKKGIVGKIFSFKLFILVSILIIVFLGTNLGKEFYRKYQIQKEIDSLKGDINSLEKNNYKLSQLIEYYETDEYKEAEARKRFNLGKDGENLVIMVKPDSDDNKTEIKKKTDDDGNLPNYKKWWNYFFAAK